MGSLQSLNVAEKQENLVLPESEKTRTIYGFLGKTGSGKTYKMRETLAKSQNQFKRILLWDSLAEHTPATLHKAGLKDFVIIGDLRSLVAYCHSVENFRVIYQPLDESIEIEIVAKIVMARGKVCFVVEEIDLLLPQSGQKSRGMLEVIKRGRHRAVSLFWTTQRAGETSKTLISMTDKLFVFRLREERCPLFVANNGF